MSHKSTRSPIQQCDIKHACARMTAGILNVVSTVLLILMNKQLMSPLPAGLAFRFPTLLSGAHYATTFLFTFAWDEFHQHGEDEVLVLSRVEYVILTMSGVVSMLSMNASLLLNSVGFYQLSKLLIMPFTYFLDVRWFGSTFRKSKTLSIAAIMVGLGIVTASEVHAGMLGLFAAVLGIISTAYGTAYVKHIFIKYQSTPTAVLRAVAPLRAFFLICLGPFLDRVAFGEWIADYDWTRTAAAVVSGTCFLGVCVQFSGVTFTKASRILTVQILNATKTVLVLCSGWIWFKERITLEEVGGTAIALAGVAWYFLQEEN